MPWGRWLTYGKYKLRRKWGTGHEFMPETPDQKKARREVWYDLRWYAQSIYCPDVPLIDDLELNHLLSTYGQHHWKYLDEIDLESFFDAIVLATGWALDQEAG